MKLFKTATTRLLALAVLLAGAFAANAGFVYSQEEFWPKMVDYYGPDTYSLTRNSINFNTDLTTGVGAFFAFTSRDKVVSVKLSDGSVVYSNPLGYDQYSPSTGFFMGFTTDKDPAVLHIEQVVFPSAIVTGITSGLDILVPEPSTIVAGALLLLPFGASALRIFRKNRAA